MPKIQTLVTVRKLTPRLYGVGRLRIFDNGTTHAQCWRIITCKPDHQQLLYPSLRQAKWAASWIRKHCQIT